MVRVQDSAGVPAASTTLARASRIGGDSRVRKRAKRHSKNAACVFLTCDYNFSSGSRPARAAALS
jgi:hypothetical protein